MAENWKETIYCATECSSCHKALKQDDKRILSSYSNDVICLNCKWDEERKPDYEEASKKMIGQCMMDIELKQSDPEGYCYSHFYPYTC